KWVKYGAKNTIRLRVNNELIYNIQYSHAISAETQTNWNGIVGKIELQAFEKNRIQDIQIYPDVKGKKIKLDILLDNPDQELLEGHLFVQANLHDSTTIAPALIKQVSTSDSVYQLTLDYPMGNRIKTWDEFEPYLYELTVRLEKQNTICDEKKVTFGMREVA